MRKKIKRTVKKVSQKSKLILRIVGGLGLFSLAFWLSKKGKYPLALTAGFFGVGIYFGGGELLAPIVKYPAMISMGFNFIYYTVLLIFPKKVNYSTALSFSKTSSLRS